MKVLVLGATGMLGAYSCLALANRGHQVIAASRRKTDNGFFVARGIPYLGGWELSDRGTFSLLPTDIEAVVDMAGYMPAHGDASVLPYVNSIVVGMANLCEWLRTETSCKRIIFNTTPADVSDHCGDSAPISDDAPRSYPKDGGDHAVYAICKIAATDLLDYYKAVYSFLPCVFRHMTVFGWHPNAEYHVNGEKRISPWRHVLRQCLAARPVEIWGDPRRRSELLYVDDFTDAVCRAVERTCCGIFNLPGKRPYTLEEEFQTLMDVFSPLGARHPKVYRPEKHVAAECLLSGAKAERELDWKATRSWKDACLAMREEMKNNRFVPLWGAADAAEVLPQNIAQLEKSRCP